MEIEYSEVETRGYYYQIPINIGSNVRRFASGKDACCAVFSPQFYNSLNIQALYSSTTFPRETIDAALYGIAVIGWYENSNQSYRNASDYRLVFSAISEALTQNKPLVIDCILCPQYGPDGKIGLSVVEQDVPILLSYLLFLKDLQTALPGLFITPRVWYADIALEDPWQYEIEELSRLLKLGSCELASVIHDLAGSIGLDINCDIQFLSTLQINGVFLMDMIGYDASTQRDKERLENLHGQELRIVQTVITGTNGFYQNVLGWDREKTERRTRELYGAYQCVTRALKELSDRENSPNILFFGEGLTVRQLFYSKIPKVVPCIGFLIQS
jgi:hypothetical protein